MPKHDEKGQPKAETKTEVIAEEPKTKIGDKVEATTTVEKETKTRATAIKSSGSTFRLLDGVDESKFNGQRGHVVRALKKLHAAHGQDKHFSLEEIVKNIEGLVSKTPVSASALYHLKGMAAEGQVAVNTPAPAPTKEEKPAEVAA
jgi:hypothetical protein